MNTPQSPAMVEVDRLPELPGKVIGDHLDAILRASGSALSNYTMGSTRLKMHNAMRAFEHEAIAAERAEVVRLSAECEKLRAALVVAEAALTNTARCFLGQNSEHGDTNYKPLIIVRAALATPTQGSAL